MDEKKVKVLEIREDSVDTLLNEQKWVERGAMLWMAANTGEKMNDTPMSRICFDASILFSVTMLCTIDLQDEDAPTETNLDEITATLNANFHRIMELANKLMEKWTALIQRHREKVGGLESLAGMLEALTGKDTIH